MSMLGRTIGLLLVVMGTMTSARAGDLRAGAAAVDVSPVKFPVIINGGFNEGAATKVNAPIYARAVVLDDGTTRIAIVVVDSCMLPREMLDGVKENATKSTGIPPERMLISATHTHSAPAAMGCLGSDADPEYVKFLPGKLVEVIEKANAKLAPARVGWGVIDDWEHAACRRYIRRPDRMLKDPFGELTVRANMHPGFNSPDAIGPAGPVDPGLSVMSVQSREGKPLVVLTNYSMHYFSAPAVSADYYGIFCRKIAGLLATKDVSEGGEFVGIMSQGTSGDTWLADYRKPQRTVTTKIDEYAEQIAKKAFEAYQTIQYKSDVTIAMAEAKLKLDRRVPSPERLAWAKEKMKEFAGRKPRGQPEVYAREQVFLHEEPERELKLQAVRIGELGITAIPNEVYALTGLKLKAMSPMEMTFNISLANGSEGYIPPPEQHHLGGYTTWPARTAALEVEAEPKIVERVVKLLEEVARKPRKTPSDRETAYSKAVMASKPIAYLRLSEMMRGKATILGSATRFGEIDPVVFEPGVSFYLDGPEGAGLVAGSERNRAVHLAGGRVHFPCTPNWRSVELWFWSGLPNDLRNVTGHLFAYGRDGQRGSDELFIDGKRGQAGRLVYQRPQGGRPEDDVRVTGKTVIEPKSWNHVVVVNHGDRAVIYLNGKADGEGKVPPGWFSNTETFFFGGSVKAGETLEGKIDEVAVFGEPLTAEQVAAHFASARERQAAVLPLPSGEGRGEGVRGETTAFRFQRDSDPLSTEEAMKKFHLKEGYEIELVASEPLIVDPVAIDWGPDGKLWVVEMHDYPYGMDGKMKPGGRIKYIEDGDNDGKYDKATLFMDGVNMPNGILVWRKGVLVTAAPEIFYAEDSDGDGKADVKTVLFRGFKEGNPQLRINGLRWGSDGWVYCANGKSGGSVVSEKTGLKLDLGGRDIRIKPDTGEMEALAGSSQFGRNRDDWGNWFGCDNSHPLFHFILEDYYTKRNPYVAPPDPALQLMTPANPRVFGKAKTQKRYHSFYHETTFTAACSANIYRDKLLFDDGKTHAFVCEPVHNLVHHHVLTPSGVSFTASRAADEQDREFLASEDPWFRPVMNRTGPDGALWVVDMYRYMIEHPDWLPAVGQDELRRFFRDGDDRGRIYRIYPKGKRPAYVPTLSRYPTANLAGMVAPNSNGTRGDMAQMLLSWRMDADAIEPLEKMFNEWPNARTQWTALTTLDLLGGLKAQHLRAAIRSEFPQVRRLGVRLAERQAETDADLHADVLRLAGDTDPGVRLQLALAVGQWEGPESGQALGHVAVADGGHAYTTAAVLSSAVKHYSSIVDAFSRSGKTPSGPMLHGLIATALGRNDRGVLAKLLGPVFVPGKGGKFSAEQLETFGRFLDLLSSRRSSLQQLREEKDDDLTRVLVKTGELVAAARVIAADESVPVPARVSAVQLLGRDPTSRAMDLEKLSAIVESNAPSPVQVAAVKVLGRVGDESTPGLLTRKWAERSPAVRFAAIDALIAREAWAMHLLGRIEAGEVAKLDVDLSRRQRLSRHSSPAIKALAHKLFGETADPSRQKVVEELRGSLAVTGDAVRGKKVFRENCATCHRMDNEGFEIGPDLRSVRTWTAEALLTAIIDPDRTAEPRYAGYNATLTTGEVVSGIVVNETGNSITIRRIDGQDQTILRSNLRALSSTNRSFMPIGFESALSEKDLADLFRFLQTGT